MKTIWKYSIPITDHFEIDMPKGATILYFGVQNDTPQIWVLIDSSATTEKRKFRLAGTGHPIEEVELKYVGTVLMLADRLVWHLFERGD